MTAERSASRSEHIRDQGTPDVCRLGAHSVPLAVGSGSPKKAYALPPICICPASHWSRCPYERCAGLCPASSRPRGIEGSRRPCQHGACWGASSVDRDEACESVRWRPRLLPRPSNHGRWLPSGSPRGGCLLGRPQCGASSPVCPYPSDSLRSLGPPGGGYAS
jgi:hypothetical protein